MNLIIKKKYLLKKWSLSVENKKWYDEFNIFAKRSMSIVRQDFRSKLSGEKGESMNTVLEKIRKMGIVPVVVIENEKDAVPLADALCNGGLACAEVTFRTAAAGEAIRLMKEAHPEMLVGAGTVLTVDQVDRAVQAGAEFIVSPGFDPEIVDYCIEKKIPVLPGCITPSEAARQYAEAFP